MTVNTQLSNSTVTAQAQVIVDDLDTGYLRFYKGAQPANANTPITTQLLLAELRFKSPSAPTPVDGVITFTNPDFVNALADGAASFYRTTKADGVSVVMDGSVGKTNANAILNNTTFVAGAKVTITGFMHTVEKSAGGY